jgi:hypothetical protein
MEKEWIIEEQKGFYIPPLEELKTLSCSIRSLIPLRCFEGVTRNGASVLLSVNQSIENVV